ncbi:hypothetical protein E3Q22_01630 [Wallemia mellicola]|uniref:Ceramide glucosyltransferase n=2 Tax=Wallemia mellicola TaxID=1708541 RepID=A0A4T0R136_9BASI|nr:hypothetical protein WALSEDRAFT_37085 [Wallemia mellicola CBS 633.66]TIB80912.1 hypothetical protein E3Q22_01630 [Wallemia mellicola]EIM22322.1 hypothetical protein WALSEDRAFT_37085 [Wallemia mellicola CBS 633.66]TIC02554.1 hypothetical protein E3Q17_01406 [Wallemia mellicola]TIC15527.1 hypothetical protein E3Q15_01445 [Wallemia mellicola]TIC19064.1 hypothetical protein E3Q13_01439 [Wallemia mellicola]|eukprot:XP_006957577.1 hypothetical protein WALSEDRAFT_37085 [Wallemia mellicola CBS 633.66]
MGLLRLAGRVLAVGILGWSVVLCGVFYFGYRTTKRKYKVLARSPLSSLPRERVPGVTLIRPLKGLDPNLYANLESGFQQDYSNLEIIFAVASDSDPSIEIAEKLISKYPDVPSRILVGETLSGVNPKVNNLIKAFYGAHNDILWIVDSNVQLNSGVCARSVDALQRPSRRGKRVGLVHHIPMAVHPSLDIGAQVERVFVNTVHFKMYTAINELAIDSCVMGKSNMYRRSDVERLEVPSKTSKSVQEPQGSIEAFSRYLAEDNMIARAIWHDLGLDHAITDDIVGTNLGDMSLRQYIDRRVRWIRVRKYMVWLATILEPLTESVTLIPLIIWSLKNLTGARYLELLAFPLFAGWLGVDLAIINTYKYASPHYISPIGNSLPQFIAFWCLRELLAFPIYLMGVFGSNVGWRSGKYKMIAQGEAIPQGSSV